MKTPSPTPLEARDQAVFLALMWALSRPGEVQKLETGGANGLEAVGLALLDLETSFYTSDPALYQTFLRLGARPEPPDKAAYLFFSPVDEAALDAIAQAPLGTLLHPEQAATLVLAGALGRGPRLRLRGPGIREATLLEAGLLEPFWRLRAERISFPLGWDALVVFSQGECVGIPRSTLVEVI
ncbi:phosphonate C-P lyase system protein PhnH [uncultured Meiothermus sp.]|jgi:alpha-D-ribose 1-methylphosphonate 5-triphosphate synthase subunit PhnH|uniref:phosphonate C-P lyase system protein PhnH n=1 Tax=uncultured Meiothermus sp. TaxID=157471 RepID=UPI002613E042|nr:phosphonate C-P lyase system protein PhnH [uncultured Meiothermus sp.]